MSEYSSIENHLRDSFEDFRLSKSEKYSLRTLLEDLDEKEEMLSYARNKAFDIFRDGLREDKSHFVAGTNWLERVVKTIDNVRNDLLTPSPSADFSPGTQCADQIIDCLHKAKRTIDICVFTISDNRISESILEAHRNGKSVRVLSDNDKAGDDGSDIEFLAEQGVPVKLDNSPYHMHHKFALFDNDTLINGSFNWTRSASTKNEENIVTMYDPNLIAAFKTTFENLWKESRFIN